MKPVMKKIQKVGNSYYVSIPKFVVDQRGYKKGDTIKVDFPLDKEAFAVIQSRDDNNSGVFSALAVNPLVSAPVAY